MSLHVNDTFSFFVPIEIDIRKGKGGKDEMRVKGIASYLSEDSDGEILEPIGFDYAPLLSRGFLNWDHQAKKTASAIIGEVTHAEIIQDGKAFYIEGFLYKGSQEAEDVYKLATILQNNSPTRRLGYSIEGQVIERGCGPEFFDDKKTIRNPEFDPALWRIIKRCRITGVAITPVPKNPNTLLQVMKGELSAPLMACEFDCDIKKAMEAAGMSEEGLLPEHIEGTKNPNKIPLEDEKGHTCPKCDHDQVFDGKCLECGYEVGKLLNKSDVYNLIAQNYTTDAVLAKQIYSLVQNTQEKLFKSMTDNKTSLEAVNAAFAFLSKAQETNIAKSDNADNQQDDEEDKDNDNDGDDDGEKSPPAPPKEGGEDKDDDSSDQGKGDDGDAKAKAAEEIAARLLKKGMSEDDTVDELEKGGFTLTEAQTAVSSVVSAANAAKDGGTITKVSPAVTKGEEDQISATLKEGVDFESLVKGLENNLTQYNDRKFSALGTLLKAQREQNELLKGELNTLTTKLSTMEQEVAKIGSQSTGRKSMVGAAAAQPVERFQKSETITDDQNTYYLSKGDDVNALLDIMQADLDQQRGAGRRNTSLEDGIANLEISKSVSSELIGGYFRTKGITIRK